ncbi:type II secretion system F family protein [Mobilitalea sibirica]|uniref:Type II secretion system F family protein n=1 Tax=Mobilitalea sibirica TaxID=1462919 RepID=A0A8J7HDP3_9FIRM|nr:type II secretion system F family protein [Mobilitalea sibirica]MBH1941014.1 type II secretion system F family protein [Mobilitalea sibirica]
MLQGTLYISLIGGLFYQSIFGVVVLLPVVWLYCKKKKTELINKRKWELNQEFKDGIISLSAALSVGYSVEHALEEAVKDLNQLYKPDAYIVREFTYIVNQIKMNISVEKALSNFANRSGVEDIVSFAEVFSTAKRTGGDLIQIIKMSSNTISSKIDVKREIITLITAKKYEADIMKVIPLGILLYLSFSSPGFLAPLYHNLFGITVMSLLLMIYFGAYLLADKIVSIEV